MELTCRYGGRPSSSTVLGLKVAASSTPSGMIPFPLDRPSFANPVSLPSSCPVPGDPTKNRLVAREARDMALPQIPTESPAGLRVGELRKCNWVVAELF
jgi:hypothetical protein